MSRVLAIVERRVPPEVRGAYLGALAARRDAAAATGARFWVFEAEAKPGVFVEFTEGASGEVVARAFAAGGGGDTPPALWREAGEG